MGRTKYKGKEEGTRETVDPDDQKAESNADGGKMKSEDAPNELKNKGKLFVGGLCPQTTSKGLEVYFSQFGKVVDAVVLRFPDSGRSRGFGFVTFADVSDAESAALNDSHLLDGKNIEVRPFVSSKPSSKTSKKEVDFRVFLGGLPENISTDLLKEFFGRYGEVKSVIIPLDKKTRKPKGFGFMSFKSEDAVEKCLAEDFVYLGGRRIHIKRANPRSSSHSGDAIEIAEDCLESDALSLEDMILWDKRSTSSNVDNDSSSIASGEGSEDFFSPKWSNFNAMYSQKTGKEERNFNELLSDFLINCNIACSGSDENLISFSDASESEESNTGTHSDCDGDVSDNGADAGNDAKLIRQLQKELVKVLRDDLSVGGVVNDADGGDCGDVQSSSPLKFKDNDGSLFCSLCQWAPEDNSCESFLDHCRTTSHRNKLKDRFPREPCQTGTNKHTEGSSKPKEKMDSKPKPSGQKSTVQQGTSKGQDKIQTQGKGLKQNQAEQQQKVKNPGGKAVKKGGDVEIKNAAKNLKPENCESEKDKRESIKGLKVRALAKGMSCIQPASGETLKCTMCKKVIPNSEDFNTVMKNVSMHLQSKGHLKNLLQTENMLKDSLEKKQEETKSKSVKNPPSQKTQDKAPSHEQKGQNKPASQEQKGQNKPAYQEQKGQNKPASQEQKGQNKPAYQEQKGQNKPAPQEQKGQNKPAPQEQKGQNKPAFQEQKGQNKPAYQEQKGQNKPASQEQRTQDKASKQKQKNVTKDTGTKKSQDKNCSSKLCFLCVPCNYFNPNIELFKVHLKSESHLDCFISRGVNTELSFDNLSKCSSCEMYLYGSLYYINKHYSKCSEKKT